MARSNEDIVREMHARWEAGDFATADYFDPDVEFVRIGGGATGTPGHWHGIDDMWRAIVEWLQAWDDFRVEARRYFAAGDRVLVVEHQTARGRHSGLVYDREIGHLFTMKDGKIVRWDNFWDIGEAFQAAGVRGEH